ncbi:hypothetical protein NEUTE2DRAFT_73480 [Neurospora tetrasperma FGSC 2509]|nr:hypothetical protein NEUTE2DRAFT_73480 [Neurospora tetrasperma FGSC 2509]
MSAFGDRRHAKNRGRQRYGPVTLYEIETQLLLSPIVFNAVKLCDLLDISFFAGNVSGGQIGVPVNTEDDVDGLANIFNDA